MGRIKRSKKRTRRGRVPKATTGPQRPPGCFRLKTSYTNRQGEEVRIRLVGISDWDPSYVDHDGVSE